MSFLSSLNTLKAYVPSPLIRGSTIAEFTSLNKQKAGMKEENLALHTFKQLRTGTPQLRKKNGFNSRIPTTFKEFF